MNEPPTVSTEFKGLIRAVYGKCSLLDGHAHIHILPENGQHIVNHRAADIGWLEQWTGLRAREQQDHPLSITRYLVEFTGHHRPDGGRALNGRGTERKVQRYQR